MSLQSRPPQVSPKSKFRDGSTGSKIETDNPRKYPESSPDVSKVMCGSRGHETQEAHCSAQGHAGNSNIPKETDHPFAADAVIDNRIHDDSPEMVRRQNSLARDRRTGTRISGNRVYPDNA